MRQDVEPVQAAWSAWALSLDGQLPAKSVTVSPSAQGRLGCRVEVKAVAKAGGA